MKHRIITISREFGSGGRTIGKEVARQLEIPCYDEEIINRIAKKSGLAEEYIKESGEYAASASKIGSLLAVKDFYGHSIQDELWGIQRRTILEIAREHSCVIVGRCADYIPKEKADLLKVFIHASIEKRAERIVKVYGENDVAPEKRLMQKDKKRRAYYQLYTDEKWGNIDNYHVSLDSGVLGIEKCIKIISSLY